MTDLLAIERYEDVAKAFTWDALWSLFDGDRTRMNIAHECIDRHRGKGDAARCLCRGAGWRCRRSDCAGQGRRAGS